MKILLLDIEVAPNLAYVWKLWDENIPLDRLIESGYILCWSAKWLGNPKVFMSSRRIDTQRAMLLKLKTLLHDADAVIHYNGKRFDIPHINGAFLKNDIAPPSPYKQIDLLETVKTKFKFPSNKLDYVCKELGLPSKTKTTFDLWVGCINNDVDSWKKMEEYNINDVIIMEELYYKLRPWITKHANQALFADGTQPVCPTCGGTHLVKRGVYHTLATVYQRYRCQTCGTWSKDNKALNKKQYKTTGVV
jgi:predicted RNA-binding Zn-ribbon protein involved in translation (DUF1610 family)